MSRFKLKIEEWHSYEKLTWLWDVKKRLKNKDSQIMKRPIKFLERRWNFIKISDFLKLI